ncbi:hypothetical protein M2306_001910 [Myroides gitamensis]|uniref:hypothetical protein n=1 Tax=Myroides odoratus TaxID=256 RepID=UPI002168C10F|nr:hypothetical protein [Myroides odoratus]MCS4239709.1 hypothetical protein [Myroides odoratus]MDH6601216.1 hypothetical protein [Myroides gitamensis]
MKKILFILFILIQSNTLSAQNWSIDLSYEVRDTIFTYYIDSDPTMLLYKDINRSRDTREFNKIIITKERAKEIFTAIQHIKNEINEVNDEAGFRDYVEVFVTLRENDIIMEFSFFDHQVLELLTRLIELLETCKEKKSIFVNFIHSDGPPPPAAIENK